MQKKKKKNKKEKNKKNKTKKVTVNIDTRFRSDYYNTTSSMFNYEIPEIQKNVTNIKIGSIEMPITNYNISEYLNNNTFLIISDANTRVVEYDVSGSWRLHMQIGDISSDYYFGTITENTNINVVDTSQAATPGFVSGNVPSYHSNISYTPSITPIYDVYFTIDDPPETYELDVSNTDYSPLKAEQLNKYESLSDVVANDVSDNYKFPRTRNNLPQYSRIIKDVSFAHPETGVMHTYDFGEIPGSVKTKISEKSSNYVKTITTETITTKYYNFVNYRWCRFLEGVWNGLDGNHSTDSYKNKVLYSEIFNNDMSSNTARPSKGINGSTDKYGVYTNVSDEIWFDTKKINIYSPRGNPRRTDISFQNLTYLDNSVISPPYDCSFMYERTKQTSIKKSIHLKALRYYNLQKQTEVNNFNPTKSAWLVKLPDGNYDEAWIGKEHQFERIVNDAINIAIPGAIDIHGNFASIIDPQPYDFLNSNIIDKNSVFMDVSLNNIRINNLTSLDSDLRFTVDRISKRSVFATSSNRIQLDDIIRITKVNKFFIRESQSGIRTVFGNWEDWSGNFPHPRQGELYPEMATLLSKSRESKKNVKKINKKSIKIPINMLRFNVDNYGNLDIETNIQYKLGWILGFRLSEYKL